MFAPVLSSTRGLLDFRALTRLTPSALPGQCPFCNGDELELTQQGARSSEFLNYLITADLFGIINENDTNFNIKCV